MNKTLIMALLALSTASSVQARGLDNFSFDNDETGFSIISQFGMNISNFRMNQLPGSDMDPKAGFNVGIHAEYLLPQCYGVYINAGLEYSMKGAKDKLTHIDIDENEHTTEMSTTYVSRPMYLQVPIHVGYRYNVIDNLGVYADFGPYFALGTNGKNVTKYEDYRDNESTRFFTDKSDFYRVRRADFGIGFRLGAEYAHHYSLTLSCDWGLTDMLTQSQKHEIVENTGYKSPSMKNFAAGLTFGYRF